jgi:hypothetical protein
VKLLEDLVKHMLDVVGSFGALLGNETKRQELFFKAHRDAKRSKQDSLEESNGVYVLTT